jgi:membrane fusion protein (multidrug efflux system)
MTNKIDNSENTNSTSSTKEKPFYLKKRVIITSIIVLFLFILILNAYNYSTTFVWTDNASIECHTVRISSKVAGTVKNVYINDNQKVKKGTLLAEIEDSDYQVKYNQAVAKLEAAKEKLKSANINVNLTSITSKSTNDQVKSSIGEAKANVVMTEKQIAKAKANLAEANEDINSAKAEFKLAEINYTRYEKLYRKGVVSKQDFDKASTTYQTQQAKLNSTNNKALSASSIVQFAYANNDAATKSLEQTLNKFKGSDTVSEQVAISDSQRKIAKADIKQLESAVAQTKLDLGYTKIYAPQSGTITSKSMECGSYIQIGQPLFTIIPEDRWIIANFKETQITGIKIGQHVNIKADAYPNKTFKGKIDSIQLSTGAKTSLFPPENAVGSYVKVVQRVPVKIIFDEKISPQYIIVPGMSVTPQVKIK